MSIDFESIAQNPKKASNENGSMEMHSLKDMIEAERYQRTKDLRTAGKSPFAMGLTKGIPPSAR